MHKLTQFKVLFKVAILCVLISSTGFTTEFIHPGLLNSKAELDFIKEKISKNQEPWSTAFAKMKSSALASPSYNPKPRADVQCGGFNIPNNGCNEEEGDAIAAYTQALMWYFTDDPKYAAKSIEILNAWAKVHKKNSDSNAPLVAGWSVPGFLNAAEILRYTKAGWSAADMATFASYIKNTFLSLIGNMEPWPANWCMSILEARIAMGVYLDDREIFDKAVAVWRIRAVSMIYQTSDGAKPVPYKSAPQGDMDKAWYGSWNRGIFVDGLSQETCRDVNHTVLGLVGLSNVPETAKHQGLDLYKEQQKRITDFMEFHAGLYNGDPRPAWLCGGKVYSHPNTLLPASGGNPLQTWETAYNHYHNVLGMELPKTTKVIGRIRPTGGSYPVMRWETLTHANLPTNIYSNIRVKNQEQKILKWNAAGLTLNTENGTVQIEVFNTLGKLFFSQQISGQQIISLNHLPPGLYRIKLLDSQGKHSDQLIMRP